MAVVAPDRGAAAADEAAEMPTSERIERVSRAERVERVERRGADELGE